MANSILNNSVATTPQGSSSMLQQYQQFRQAFRGDPKQMVNELLQSGRFNNSQIQQAMQLANQYRGFIR